jgi:hypothetical protein
VSSGTLAALDAGRLTRRELLVRGSLALAATSTIGRLALRAGTAAAAVPESRCAVGAFIDPRVARSLQAAGVDPASQLETLIGRPLRLSSTFVAWEEQFPNAGHLADRAAGRSPLIAWDGRRDLAAIAAGTWDALLRERAAACRAYGKPIYLRWGAEFNGEWNPAFGQTRAFAAAWRHMVQVFRSVGADNVKWVFCPYAFTTLGSRTEDWRAYYPGDTFVDWVGMDGYNWGAARPWSRWQSFGEIFGPLYADYAGRKPLMICEVASTERGGDKAAWISDMARQLRGRFSRVRAFAWFDIEKETDWRVNSSPAALAAFRGLVAESRYA